MEEKCLEILGFSQRPSERDLKKAYKALIKQHHPDVTGGQTSRRYTEIDAAYKYLTGKITYREAALILYPKNQGTSSRSDSSQAAYDYRQTTGGFSQEDFDNMFGSFYGFDPNSDEYDEDGYYRHKYYRVDFAWLKWLPLIFLVLFLLFMVIFFKFLAFLFTPAGLVLLALYLVWRSFFRKPN